MKKKSPLTPKQKTDRRNEALLEACYRDSVPVKPKTGEINLSYTITRWGAGELIMVRNPNWNPTRISGNTKGK